MKNFSEMSYKELSDELSSINQTLKEARKVKLTLRHVGLQFKIAALKIRKRDVLDAIYQKADTVDDLTMMRVSGNTLTRY